MRESDSPQKINLFFFSSISESSIYACIVATPFQMATLLVNQHICPLRTFFVVPQPGSSTQFPIDSFLIYEFTFQFLSPGGHSRNPLGSSRLIFSHFCLIRPALRVFRDFSWHNNARFTPHRRPLFLSCHFRRARAFFHPFPCLLSRFSFPSTSVCLVFFPHGK